MMPSNPLFQALPYRLGATSYSIPADLLANARYLAGQVQDMELVLFDIDGGPSNLPDSRMVRGLQSAAEAGSMTFTVHLPLDLRLESGGGGQHESLIKARRVIDATRTLVPYAYVAHLDGREVRTGASAGDFLRWQDQAVQALEIVSGWVGGPENLALENLEGYPLAFLLPVLDRVPVSRCVDVGHLWLDGHDPLPYLEQAIPRTRVIHLHGLAHAQEGDISRVQDHRSLAAMPFAKIDALVATLDRLRYSGVVTLEVFDENDFQSSLRVMVESIERKKDYRWQNH
jgi:sugar phosphate isomerase/epimerase